MPQARRCFEHPDMDLGYFMQLADRFRSPHLWMRQDGRWKLRHTPYEGESECNYGAPAALPQQ